MIPIPDEAIGFPGGGPQVDKKVDQEYEADQDVIELEQYEGFSIQREEQQNHQDKRKGGQQEDEQVVGIAVPGGGIIFMSHMILLVWCHASQSPPAEGSILC